MTLRFSKEEQHFIVNDVQTDLLLTSVGMKLVEEHPDEDGFVVVTISQNELEEFACELREEFVWKSRRITGARILVDLARRLLPDFDSLQPLEFH